MRRVTLLLLLLFAGVLLPGTSLVAHAAREATDFVRRDSDDLLRMGGVWRSRGYGWIWQIADGRVKVYDATPAYCVARRSHRGLPGEAGSDAWISRDGRTVVQILYNGLPRPAAAELPSAE